jgi:hypothetical protein
MNNHSTENKTWLQRIAAVDIEALDSEQTRFLIETGASVVKLGWLPAIEGQPAREASIEERLETARFMVAHMYPVPEPI